MWQVPRLLCQRGTFAAKSLSSCLHPRLQFARNLTQWNEPSFSSQHNTEVYPTALSSKSSSGPLRVSIVCRHQSTDPKGGIDHKPTKPSLYRRFKQMYKDYWYVLLPVHVVTSCMWFGGFYYTAQSGFDVAGALEFLHLSDEVMDKIRHSTNSFAGHITISYLLYKLFTPLRYTVTLGGTTYTIKYLTARGLLKKMPKSAELKEMMVKQKDSLKDKSDNLKKGFVGKFSSSNKNLLPPLEQQKAP